MSVNMTYTITEKASGLGFGVTDDTGLTVTYVADGQMTRCDGTL